MKIPALAAAAAVILGIPGVSSAQYTWVTRAKGEKDFYWYASGATAGGVFLLSGTEAGEGRVVSARSTDGVTWTRGSLPGANGVFSGGGMSVGLGQDTIWTTKDGVTVASEFNFRSLPRIPENFIPMEAAFGAGVWVVVGMDWDEDGRITPYFRSTDMGATWTAGSFPRGSLGGLAFGNGEFLVYGSDASPDPDGLWASPDGRSFTKRLVPAPAEVVLPIFWWNSAWHAGGQRSTDGGRTWKRYVTGSFTPEFLVAPGPEALICLGYESDIYVSVTGETWERRVLSTDGYFNTAIYGNGFFVAAGEDGLIMTSAAGPAPGPLLEIEAGFQLTFPSQASRRYQLQSSADGRGWTDEGPPADGDGNPLRFFRPAQDARKSFRMLVR